MSGHLDGPPPGPPDPPYIPGDLGAPSAEEFARRRASPEPERNPYLAVSPHEIIQERADRLARCWDEGFAAGRAAATPDPPCAHGLTGGRGATERCFECGASVPAASPDERLRQRRTVLDPETGIEEPVTTGRIPDAEFVEPPLMPPAASPDERLREATDALATIYVILTGAEPMWAEMPLDERCARAANEAQQAFLAADREAPEGIWPDQSAVHGVLLEQVKDAYAEGITDTVAKLRVRAAEMLPEVARFTLDEIEAIVGRACTPSTSSSASRRCGGGRMASRCRSSSREESPVPDPTPTPREEWRVMDGDDQVCRHAGHTAEWAEDQCRRLVERFPEESFRIERRAAGGEWEAYCPASTPMGSCSPRCGDPRCEEATRVR